MREGRPNRVEVAAHVAASDCVPPYPSQIGGGAGLATLLIPVPAGGRGTVAPAAAAAAAFAALAAAFDLKTVVFPVPTTPAPEEVGGVLDLASLLARMDPDDVE